MSCWRLVRESFKEVCISSIFFLFLHYAVWSEIATWNCYSSSISYGSSSYSQSREKKNDQVISADPHLALTTFMRQDWKKETVGESTMLWVRLLYTSTIAKIDLLYKDRWWDISTLWLYNCLLWQGMDLRPDKFYEYHGRKRSYIECHFSKTRLWINSRTAILRWIRGRTTLKSIPEMLDFL